MGLNACLQGSTKQLHGLVQIIALHVSHHR